MTASRRPIRDPGQPRAGERARQHLLEVAGEVFALRGYAQATSKEICEQAGMNSASVNYYFGGFEPLYAETLAHAHQKLIAIEALRGIAASDASPRQKLREAVALVIRRLALPATSWEMRVIGREIVSPSPARDAFVKSQILPKLEVWRGIIAAILGAEPDDPVVGRSLLTVVSPCMMLAITPRDTVAQILPGLADAPAEIDPLIDHIERFIHAGLEAVAADIRHSAKPPDA